MFRSCLTLVIPRRAVSALGNRYPAQVGQRPASEEEVAAADSTLPDEEVSLALRKGNVAKVEDVARKHVLKTVSLDLEDVAGPAVAASRPVVTERVQQPTIEKREEPRTTSVADERSEREAEAKVAEQKQTHHHQPHHREHEHRPATHGDVAKAQKQSKPQVRPGAKPLARSNPGSRVSLNLLS
jgi:hypothetical protein